MKPVVLRIAMMLALLPACVGIGSAQTSNDLLQTGSGTQEDLSSLGLGVVPFQSTGTPLAADTGAADTIVQHAALNGGQVSMRIVALHLRSVGTVTCGDPNLCGSFLGNQVDVEAIINVPDNPPGCITNLPTTQDLSSGTLTPSPDNTTFNSSFDNVQAQIVATDHATGTQVFSTPGPPTSMSATGGTLSPTPPDGYPNSTCFPTVAPFVTAVAGGPGAFVTGLGGRVFRASLWGLGGLFLGFAGLMLRSSVKNGRLNLRPVYLAGLAVLAWFVAWRAPNYPRIVYANGASRTVTGKAVVVGSTSCAINFEQATLIQHGVAPAKPNPCQ